MNVPQPTQVGVEGFYGLLAAAAPEVFASRLSKRFSVSSAMDCLRQYGYEILGHDPTDDKVVLDYKLAAAAGDGIHGALESVLAKTEDLGPGGVLTEISVSSERHLLGGRLDAHIALDSELAFQLELESGDCLLEIKTVASKYLVGKSVRYFGEKLSHYAAQAQYYMHLYRTATGQQVPQAVLLVMSRDEPKDRRMYALRYDHDWCEAEFNRIEGAAQDVRNGQLPAPEPSRGICTLCRYRSACPAGGLL